MGTSNRSNGPNRSPLLPPDFNLEDLELGNPNEENNSGMQEPENDKNKDLEQKVTWQSAKSSMTRYVRGAGTSPNRPISNYVKASGGSKNITRSSGGAVRSTVALGSFINQVKNSSFREAVESLGFQFEGKNTEDILIFLAEELSPNPSDKEDAVARTAMIETLSDLYDELDQSNEGIEKLNQINQDTLSSLIVKYIINYIYERILSELGKRFEDGADSSEEAVAKEIEVKDYITAVVETSQKMRDVITYDFKSSGILSFVASTFIECYSILENL